MASCVILRCGLVGEGEHGNAVLNSPAITTSVTT